MSNTVHLAAASSIAVPEERQRKSYSPEEARKLEQSILKHGQLQPGVCRKDGNKIVLIAGHRRLLACETLQIPYKYLLFEEISDPLMREEMELHENLMRENLTFKEEAAARAKLHQLYMETRGTQKIRGNPTWGIEKTAKELGISKASLADDLEIVKYSSVIPQVADAKNRSEAKKTIKRLKEQTLREVALEQIGQRKPDLAPPPDADDTQVLEHNLSCALEEYNKCIHNTDMLSYLTTTPNRYQIVFFDPPWGVDFDSAFQLSGTQKGYSDKRKAFFTNLQSWLTAIHSVMADNSHLYIKFGIVHHFWVVRLLMRVGFVTNGIPIIWQKEGAHRTRTPSRWPGRCYEPILLAHKGSKPLQIEGKPDIITTPAPTPKLKDIHPSAMHPQIIKELLERSAFPGDHVLDPMAGSGMTGVAADKLSITHGLKYTLIEQDTDYCNLIRANLLKGYDAIVSDVTDINLITDFRQTTPGTVDWIRIWTEQPDQRDAMVKWAEER